MRDFQRALEDAMNWHYVGVTDKVQARTRAFSSRYNFFL